MMRKRKPTDLVQLKIRMTEALRAQLEEEANRRGGSINAEVVYRVERTIDRSNLLGEVLTLAFGRQLAGLLMALGTVMSVAAANAGRDPNREDWALEVEAYAAARHAAEVLLSLWQPKMWRAGEDWDAATAVRTARDQGIASVESVMKWLNEEMRNPKRKALPEMMLEFLGPIAAGMIEEFPHRKKMQTEAHALGQSIERTTTLKKKAS